MFFIIILSSSCNLTTCCSNPLKRQLEKINSSATTAGGLTGGLTDDLKASVTGDSSGQSEEGATADIPVGDCRSAAPVAVKNAAAAGTIV